MVFANLFENNKRQSHCVPMLWFQGSENYRLQAQTDQLLIGGQNIQWQLLYLIVF